jgi:8-oxo-dGTP pyrophosphatase MutT (NUDIX family)
VSNKLVTFYKKIITPDITSPIDYQRFTEKLQQGLLTRDEDILSHFCAMTLVYDSSSKKMLLVFHKKANSWIFPGGHIEECELPTEAAIREAKEEIGLTISSKQLIGPFGAQILDINNPLQMRREHYDIFYAIDTNPSKVHIDMSEFLAYEWLTLDQARQRITMLYYKEALEKFITYMDW